MGATASLGRLRYWLPLFQAPTYGTGFIASEGHRPSVLRGYWRSLGQAMNMLTQVVQTARPSTSNRSSSSAVGKAEAVHRPLWSSGSVVSGRTLGRRAAGAGGATALLDAETCDTLLSIACGAMCNYLVSWRDPNRRA